MIHPKRRALVKAGIQHLPYAKSDSNTFRRVLEKLVDTGENRSSRKTKTMLRTTTLVIMTNPSRGLAFYFRPRDGEHYDRVFNRRLLTWTHYETLQIA